MPSLAYDYTAKGNMVAVVSNGTAVLGLGNLGAVASKPVMEGKIALFKRFADIDGIDLEIDSEDVDDVVNAVRFLAGFGGINLEDIKAPECFVIEQRLRELMDIPVFHDDQHGTAIVAAAGLINACHLTGRELRDTKLVVNGAGAAGIACVELLKAMGMRPEHVVLCDTKGVVYQGRTDGMNQWKSAHAAATKARTLTDALDGADVFFGLSVKGAVTKDMVAPHGGQADHLRDGESRSRDHAGGGARGQPARDHRHRPQRLSQSGQQRSRLPLHLPRRARRARQHDQRGDEDRRGRGAGQAGARGRAGRGAFRLGRAAADLRAGLHHPERVRSAADLLGAAGGGARGDGERRRAPAADRSAPLCARPVGAARSDRRRARRDHGERARQSAAAWCSPRARRRRWCAPPSPIATPATAGRC